MSIPSFSLLQNILFMTCILCSLNTCKKSPKESPKPSVLFLKMWNYQFNFFHDSRSIEPFYFFRHQFCLRFLAEYCCYEYLCMYFCVNMFSVLLVTHLEVGFLDHRWQTTGTTEAAPFYTSIQSCMRVQFLHIPLLFFFFFKKP